MTLKQVTEYARAKHAGQFRRDGITPYFNHVEAVMSRVVTEDEKMVAALHDLIEDGRATWDDMREAGIPGEIISYVLNLTHGKGEDYFDYIRRIQRSVPIVINVKLADILANLADKPTKKQIHKYAVALLMLNT